MDKQTAERLTAPQVLQQLQCTDEGLTQSVVAERHSQYGRNVLMQEHATAWRVLARQFQSPLIYILIVAAILAFAIRDLSDGVIITAILLINAALGFSQEYRSERAVQQLSHLISNKVLAKRDGQSILVDVADLVPGDIVTLKEGDVVPADIKLLTATDLQVDESQLTGESVPVAKAPGASTAADLDASLLFTGSTVDTGEGTGVVYAVADETALGKIAALSTSIRKTTQYETSLRDFSTLLIRIIGLSLAVTLLLKILLVGTSHMAELAIFVIALAVAVVPEALPVIATLTLSRGALQLARQKVIVKRLSSLEDLGNVTILCTDKTGTLTENRPTIQHLVSRDDHLFQLLAYASIDRGSQGAEGTQTSFDAAFEAYVPENVKSEAKTFRIVQEVPFDPAARRRRVVLADSASGKRYLVVIGAPETLLALTHCDDAAQYRDQMAAEGRQGMRHLALAYRELGPTETGDAVALEKDLVFLGFVSLADPLRPSTPQTLAKARQLGVTVKILTGDNHGP
ncbi:MAG TPA: HAD-IC family P-type ATPase, partial [Chloroflexota bacterium]